MVFCEDNPTFILVIFKVFYEDNPLFILIVIMIVYKDNPIVYIVLIMVMVVVVSSSLALTHVGDNLSSVWFW